MRDLARLDLVPSYPQGASEFERPETTITKVTDKGRLSATRYTEVPTAHLWAQINPDMGIFENEWYSAKASTRPPYENAVKKGTMASYRSVDHSSSLQKDHQVDKSH